MKGEEVHSPAREADIEPAFILQGKNVEERVKRCGSTEERLLI